MADTTLFVNLVPACLNCADLEPEMQDDRDFYETYERGTTEKHTRGSCIFTCSHRKVCKKAIDSNKKLVLMSQPKEAAP